MVCNIEEEFKKKVVEEYKKGDLSLEEIATKYGLPPALLQDWVNKDDVNNIFISYVERPEEKISIFTKVKTACIIAFSEELRKNDPEKYTEYLSTVLREIHQDPLRKRGKEKEDDSYKDSAGILGRVIDLAQAVIKQNNE